MKPPLGAHPPPHTTGLHAASPRAPLDTGRDCMKGEKMAEHIRDRCSSEPFLCCLAGGQTQHPAQASAACADRQSPTAEDHRFAAGDRGSSRPETDDRLDLLRDKRLNGEIFATLYNAQVLTGLTVARHAIRPPFALRHRPPTPETILPLALKPSYARRLQGWTMVADEQHGFIR